MGLDGWDVWIGGGWLEGGLAEEEGFHVGFFCLLYIGKDLWMNEEFLWWIFIVCGCTLFDFAMELG